METRVCVKKASLLGECLAINDLYTKQVAISSSHLMARGMRPLSRRPIDDTYRTVNLDLWL